jgi:TATA-box binding protein (TBP) (component of TFIID and TFIIIB)
MMSAEPETDRNYFFVTVLPALLYLMQMLSPQPCSGKIVLTKATTRRQVQDAFDKIYPVLTQFRSDQD